jgi:hypothetical protein
MSRGALITLAVITVLAVAGLAIFLLNGPDPPPPPGELQLEILHAEDSGVLTIQASQRFGSVEAAWPFADLVIDFTAFNSTPDGNPFTFLADYYGQVQLDLFGLCESLGYAMRWDSSDRLFEVTVTATDEGRSVTKSYKGKMVMSEVFAALEKTAEDCAEEGPAGAVQAYQRMALMKPEDPNLWLSVAMHAERADLTIDALLAYREYLIRNIPPETEDTKVLNRFFLAHRKIQEKAVSLAKKLKSPLPATPVAVSLLAEAQALAAADKFIEANQYALQAENAAPWWPEAYYRAGLIRLAMILQYRSAVYFDSWDFERAIELDPRSDLARSASALIEEGKAALQDS